MNHSSGTTSSPQTRSYHIGQEQINLFSSSLPYCFSICLGIWLLKLPLTTSFWLDETISWWVQSDGWAATWSRSQTFQGHPLYFLVLKLWCGCFGDDEITIRVLSVLCSLVSIALLWMMSNRWFGRDAAWITSLMFLFSDEALTLSVSARPYALARMLGLATCYSLQRWASTQTLRWLVVTGVLSTATWYAHYFYVGILAIGIATFMLEGNRPRWQPNRKSILFVTAGTAIACAPGVLRLFDFSSQIKTLSFTPAPSTTTIATALLPKPFAALASITALLACVGGLGLGLSVIYKSPLAKKGVIISALWISAPVALFALVSSLTPESVFVSRYYSWNQLGLYCLLGGVIAAIQPTNARKYALRGMIFLIFLRCTTRVVYEENWREAFLPPTTIATFMFSGLIESKDPSWLYDTKKTEYLQSPANYYRKKATETPQAKEIISLPPDPSDSNHSRYINEKVLPLLAREKTIHLIVYRMQLAKRTNDIDDSTTTNTVDAWLNFFRNCGYEIKTSPEKKQDPQVQKILPVESFILEARPDGSSKKYVSQDGG